MSYRCDGAQMPVGSGADLRRSLRPHSRCASDWKTPPTSATTPAQKKEGTEK